MKIIQQRKIRLKFGYKDSTHHAPELIFADFVSIHGAALNDLLISKNCVPQNFVIISNETSYLAGKGLTAVLAAFQAQ